MTDTIETPKTTTGVRPRSRDELQQQMPDVLASPKDNGTVDLIIVRPEKGQRQTPDSAELSLAGGVAGDHWARGCWKSLDDGSPDPNVQICIMNSRMIRAIAGDRENWPPAGDNLFLDMDLSPGNCPPGTRLAMGSVELEITAEPHNGCQNFIDRYGRDACVFVNTGQGSELRLRGIYGRVTRDGTVSVGDTVRKI